MDTLYIILTVVLTLACLTMIVAILMQKKRDAGFSGSVGGVGATSVTAEKSHFDKARKRTLEGRLERYTKILAAVFMALALVISLMA
ncbi:MAG: preprotein translocase subunit SecG [Clostridiales bacterium]|jgi:preprotein translocase subunit SecG|nr:preprotein translocase subunit SecG [Clostridiales bacterium]